MNTKIKEIEKTFEKGKRVYRQIEATEEYYVYEVVDEDAPTYYEIFSKRIKPVKGVLLNSDKYKDYTHFVAYPSDEEFGAWAWCCSNKERVEMIKRIKFFNDVQE